MFRLLGLTFVAALSWVVALSVAAPVQAVKTAPLEPLPVSITLLESELDNLPVGMRHLPGTIDPIVADADAEWQLLPMEVTILPPPPPSHHIRAHRNYGPTPPLTGPILTTAAKYLGIYYVSGGSTPAGFDCSGFVKYVYAENGITIPRTVAGISNIGTITSNPQPGDIIVMAHHVALWVAPGWLVDSGKPGLPVQVRPIWTSAYVVIHVG